MLLLYCRPRDSESAEQDNVFTEDKDSPKPRVAESAPKSGDRPPPKNVWEDRKREGAHRKGEESRQEVARQDRGSGSSDGGRRGSWEEKGRGGRSSQDVRRENHDEYRDGRGRGRNDDEYRDGRGRGRGVRGRRRDDDYGRGRRRGSRGGSYGKRC